MAGRLPLQRHVGAEHAEQFGESFGMEPRTIASVSPAPMNTRLPVERDGDSGTNGTIGRKRIALGQRVGDESSTLVAMFAPFENPTAIDLVRVELVLTPPRPR